MSNSLIVNDGSPKLTIWKEVKAEITCPNCSEKITVNANDVDIGHIIECSACSKKTYYPFEKPLYKKGKLIVGYISSLLVTFILGLSTNYISGEIFGDKESSQGTQEIDSTGEKNVN